MVQLISIQGLARLILFILALTHGLQSAQASDRPNIIFFLSDDQRWDALGCMGNPIIQTPNLDRLAADGVRFVNNFCTTSICAVSRASFLTGQYARRHGIQNFAAQLSDEAFSQTYSGLLRSAGYRTGFIGKYGIGSELPSDKFDYFDGFAGQGKYYHEVEGEAKHLTSMMGDSAEEFLSDTSDKRPFCLSISFKAPHVFDPDKENPFHYDPALEEMYQDVTIPPAPKSEQEDFEWLPKFSQISEGRTRWEQRFITPEKYQKNVKGYYRLISGIDLAVGRIVTALMERGLHENTIIIYTSDNGFFLGERGLAGKWLMYEESIRTPLLIYDPRLPQSLRGKVREEMTLSIDIAPTIADVAEISPPASMQGRSLVPLTGSGNIAWRESWFYEHLYGHGGRIPATEGIRTQRWKYTQYIESEPMHEELFDLESDPQEQVNLVGSEDVGQQRTLNALRAQLEDYRERYK